MDVFNLMAKISLDTSEYDKGIDEAGGKATSLGAKLKGGIGTAAKIGAGALVAVGAAGAAATTAFIKGASSVAQYGDNIDKMSQKMGMSAQSYQEWDAVMQHSGTSMETMKASMKTLANAAETGSEAFTKLGISQEELASLSQEQLFERTISALQNVEDETERTYLAGKTLGRGATELGALLNTSAEDTQAMRDRVRELGGVMSDDAVKASAAYQDSLQDMQTAMSGISRGILSDMLPSMTKIMDGLTEIFAGNGDKGIGLVSKGISGLFGKINSAIPKFASIGGSIVKAVGKAIVSNIPSIIGAGYQIVTTIVTGVYKAIPGLLTAASNAGGQLVSAISNVLNSRFPSLGSAFDGIVSAAQSAIQFIKDYWSENGEEILSKASDIWSSVQSVVSTTLAGVTTVISNVVTIAKEIWAEWGDETKAVFEQALDTIGVVLEMIGAYMDVLRSHIENVVTFITDFWSMHGQTISTVASTVWGAILTTVSGILSVIQGVVTAFTAILQGNWSGALSAILGVASTIWNTITSVIQSALSAISAIVSAVLNSVKSVFSNAWNAIKSTVTNAINGVKSAISSGINAAYSTVSSVLGNIKSKFTSIFESVKSTVTNAINTIKGAFNFTWSLPHLALPHISISGSFSLMPPSVPSFGISWYKKAMQDPFLLDGASIFGASGGKLLGGGEAGREIVIGESKAIDLIRKASGDREPVNVTINVYARENQDVNALADVISRKLQKQLDRRAAVYA
jgi:phage-related protein